ncbi:hypothetical protein P43SY_010994 [Pythium insidiosum]|uniref:Integrase catalytic domain-containing protein n=1 Tax=Pythium insidiosum TaxID=114742 RepID=A0AAD5LRM1_PYTIN|nr:hypothetical protein P43SY_010994 [Pythium insidiosum]
MADMLDRLLFRLRYWRISANLLKSSFGKRAIQSLSHEVSRFGIRDTPKIANGLDGLEFPASLKALQSFLGSINYCTGHNLDRARRAFQLLKEQIASPPVLKHPDRSRPYVVILHASRWAVSTLRYHDAEKEVLALFRVLTGFYGLVVGCRLRWATLLSPWTLEVVRVERDEDWLARWHAVSITPRQKLDEVAAELVPPKASRTSLAEAVKLGICDLTVIGDSRIAIEQCAGRIQCNQAHLQLLLDRFRGLERRFDRLRLLQVKRELNGPARAGSPELDQLSQVPRVSNDRGTAEDRVFVARTRSAARREERMPAARRVQVATRARRGAAAASLAEPAVALEVDEDDPSSDEGRRSDVATPSLGPDDPAEHVPASADTRATRGHGSQRSAQVPANQQAGGELTTLSAREVANVAKLADQFVLDSDELLRVSHPITRTYDRVRGEYYWPRMFRDVEEHVRACVDCVTAKGRPPNPGSSPGNLRAEYPFQVLTMDFVMPLPESANGNTALLLFQDQFSGFVMSACMSDTSAQSVAEVYDRVVFQRFGASAIIRHDRDPRFMSKVFRCFRTMLGSQQRATLAYRPQANGQQERSVQTVIRSVRAFVEELGQSDYEDIVGRLMFALNTSYDATRKETPFYLAHGWDARTTVRAMPTPPPRGRDLLDA